jgi:hypothetical protein
MFRSDTFKHLLILSLLYFIKYQNNFAQTSSRFDFSRIEDNSFLIEEAYNQETGVIQHISAFQLMRGNIWIYSFTEEWPVGSQLHQLSATIPLQMNGNFGLSDIAINYRFQAIFRPRIAFSPRFSLLLPTGNYKRSLGTGVPGYQVNLPFSFLISPHLVTHINPGVTFTPKAKFDNSEKSDITSFNYGISLIYLLSEEFNVMLEATGSNTFYKSINIDNTNSRTFLLNPGFRYAFNFKSGLQIVPGLAIPVGIGPSRGEYGIFLYLSFEHPLR